MPPNVNFPRQITSIYTKISGGLLLSWGHPSFKAAYNSAPMEWPKFILFLLFRFSSSYFYFFLSLSFFFSFYQNASKLQLFNDNLIFWKSGQFIILNLFSQKKKKSTDCQFFLGFFEANLCFLSHILSSLMKLSSKVMDGARNTNVSRIFFVGR